MKINGIPLIILTLATFLLGAWSSFAVFRYLALNVHESSAPKDTIFVHLLNGPSLRSDSIVQQETSRAANPNGITSLNPATTTNSAGPSGQSVRNRYLLRPSAISVPEDSLKNAISAARLSQVTFPWWIAIFSGVFLLAIGFLLLYNRLPFFAPDLQKDLDPQALTDIFREFGNQIESIGNPRKIKRLSNKIRFQYHYIVGQGWTDPKIFNGLIRILLTLELKPWLNPASGNTSPDLSSETGFWQYFANIGGGVNSIPKLAHLIYILNRDPL